MTRLSNMARFADDDRPGEFDSEPSDALEGWLASRPERFQTPIMKDDAQYDREQRKAFEDKWNAKSSDESRGVCSHTTQQSCLEGDECAQCLREAMEHYAGVYTELQTNRDRLQGEVERLKEGWKQCNQEKNTHFQQSCDNLKRAELAENIRDRLQQQLDEALKDKERLDWLDFFHKNPSQFTIADCISLYKDKEKNGIRQAIDSAITKLQNKPSEKGDE